MAYTVVDNLSGGVDRSRPRYAGEPGTIWDGINGHLSRGGDFEKRKSFVATYQLPEGQTFGMAKDVDGLVVFGSDATPSMPSGVKYQQVAHPSAFAMTKMASWDAFAGLIYVIAKYSNGDFRHFYDGSIVADWGLGGNNPPGYGSIVKTFKRKIYSPIVSTLWFSELDSAVNFDITAAGSGFLDMSSHQSGSDLVTGMAEFQKSLAIFARRVVQIWNMEDDDDNNAPVQTLREIGTISPRSVSGFGDIDAFFLSDSGVRSVRARSGTNNAGVNDVGTPIDPLILSHMRGLTTAVIEDAVSGIEPVDGRFWLALGDKIFVFSYFPSKKISAWSWYEPGFTVSDIVILENRIYVRSGDVIYLYGGADNNTYDDNTKVTCGLPYLTGGKPGTFNYISGFDIAASGKWKATMLLDPNDENEKHVIGDLEGVTFPQEIVPSGARTTHVAPVLVHDAAGAASISQIAFHLEGKEEKI